MVYRIGVMAIMLAPDPDRRRLWETFFIGLREFGYLEGKNIIFEWRYSKGRAERFPELAAELARLKADLVIVYTTPVALTACFLRCANDFRCESRGI